jgi:hypothetical protein
MNSIKMTIKGEHTLEDTLFEVERLSRQYKTDLLPFIDMKLSEFFNVVSKQINYVPDPKGKELVMRPQITMRRRAGDCDDKTVLMLAWFQLKGFQCGYSIVSSRSDKDFHHIFPFIVVQGNIIDTDATYSKNKIGNFKKWAKRKNYYVSNS